jgi:Domain of unknown function (DUF4157)
LVRTRLLNPDPLSAAADDNRERDPHRRPAIGNRATAKLLRMLSDGGRAVVVGGNRSVASVLAGRDVTVSSAGDASEREATAVAEAVGHDRSPSAITTRAPGAVALPGGRPLADDVRVPLEAALSSELSSLRVHTGEAAAAAAASVQARAFTLGSSVVLGAGESAADRVLMAHEATHVLQARPGLLQRDHEPEARTVLLARYPYLRDALTPDQYAMLEDGVISRLAVPLMQLLPPDLEYMSRADVIKDVFPQLATVEGPAPNADQLVGVIAASETLRTFLEDKLRQPVTIVVDEDVRFYLFNMEVASESGMIPVGALNRVSIATVEAIAAEQHAAAVQLVDLGMARLKAEHAASTVMPLLMQIVTDPANYALQEVQDLSKQCAQVDAYVLALSASLHPTNRDLAGPLAGQLAMTRAAKMQAATTVSAMSAFVTAHWPDTTYGETYADAEEEYAEDTGLSPGGVLAGANYGATWIFHFVGNAFTAGHMDREAVNAQAYRKGLISWNAYKENEKWNFGVSLVVAAATALSAGLAGRAVSGFVGAASGLTPAGAGTITGTVVGGVSSTTGAVASDAGSKIAAWITDDRYVRAMQEASIVGPLGWLSSGMQGAMLGGLLGRVFGRGRIPSNDLAEAQEALRQQASRTDVSATPPMAPVAESSGPVAYVNGEPVPPTHYGRVYHGNDFTPAEVRSAGGFKAAGDNWDLVRHTEDLSRFEGTSDSAFRGATGLPRDAAQWGEWVYEIEGMPAWDTAKILQGKIKVAGVGEHRGVLMHGEVEHSIPGEIPLKNIVRFGRSVQVGKGVGVREWFTWDTYTE